MTNTGETASTLIESVRSLLPMIATQSEEIEGLGYLTEPVHRALVDAGVFRMWVPRSVGGLEVDLVTGLRVYELLGQADGATSWTANLGGGAGRFGAYFDIATAKEIFGSEDAFVAGSGAPTGTAIPVDGGYRATGRWKYASGSHHATWFTAACVIEGESDQGQPKVRAVAVPAADVEIHRTWDVVGMRGSGSEDFTITDVFVPERRTFSVMTDEPQETGVLYRLGFLAIAQLSFGSVATGIARGALDRFATLARSKTPMGSDHTLAEDGEVAATFGRAEAAVRSASVYIHHAARKLWKAASGDDHVEAPNVVGLEIDARLAGTHATAVCAAAIDSLHKRAGMDALYKASAFGRALRDLNATAENTLVAAARFGESGRELLERS